MTKYIDAEKIIDKINKVIVSCSGSKLDFDAGIRYALRKVRCLLHYSVIDSSDIQAVVRCKDCKYCHLQNCEPRDIYLCKQRWNYTEETDPDGFCHRGKRKECDEK